MPFKDTPEGTTNYCRRCVMEELMKEKPGHTCDTIPTPPQDWEIGLTQLISKTWKKGLWHSESPMMDDLKSFITSLLHSERERVVEGLKVLYPNIGIIAAANHSYEAREYINGFNKAKDSAIALIEKSK